MKVTLLALNLLAAAAFASMAEDFVNNLNSSATSVESIQNGKKQGQRRKTKTLRGAAKFDSINERELKNHHHHRKSDKNDKDRDEKPFQFQSNSHGLNYFVPNYPGKSQKNEFSGKFDLGYNVRPRPSNYGSSDDNKYARPLDRNDDKKTSYYYKKDKESSEDVSYVKPDKNEPKEDYLAGLTITDKEKAEEVNAEFTEETEGWISTPEPTAGTVSPSLSPTWSPTLEPTPAREQRNSVDTAAPTFDETADPTLQPSVLLTGSPTFDELTGSPTFDESTDLTLEPSVLVTGSPTFDELTGSPTFDETDPTAAASGESETLSTVRVITTTGWEADTSNVTWSVNTRPERTHPPKTPEPTEYVSTAAPTVKGSSLSPTLSPSISTDDPTMAPSASAAVSTDSPTNNSDTSSPSYYPTYLPTASNTTAPTFHEGSTTTTGATLSGSDCTTTFCEYQLSDDYLMEYRLNVPSGESVDDCQTCSLNVRLTYEGEAWLGFAFSTDGQMVGSEAVM